MDLPEEEQNMKRKQLQQQIDLLTHQVSREKKLTVILLIALVVALQALSLSLVKRSADEWEYGF